MGRRTQEGARSAGWPVAGDRLSDLPRQGDFEFVAASRSGTGGARPRVLIEHTDGAVRHAAETFLAQDGFDVAGCGGPTAFRCARCPLVTRGSCPLADSADVIVHALNPDYALNASVLEELKHRYPQTAIVAEVPAPAMERHRELVAGCQTLTSPMTRDRLVAAVRAARAGQELRSVDRSR